MNKFVFLCLILSQNLFAQDPQYPGYAQNPRTTRTDRTPLFTEAFKGLPFFIYVSMHNLNPDDEYSLEEQVTKFSAEENRMLKFLMKNILPTHGTRYKLVFCKGPCKDQEGKPVSFFTDPKQPEKYAVTSKTDAFDDIFINVKLINDPNVNLDFMEAIQILIHEICRKIPNQNEAASDTMAAQLVQNLREHYDTFTVSEKRRVHILTLDRPNTYEASNTKAMKTYWVDQQGFEVTTFDEIDGNFKSIDEVRREFSNPRLMKAATEASGRGDQPISRNAFVGVEVDRFADSTTIIRIGSSQKQTLLKPDQQMADFSSVVEYREHIVKLKGDRPPEISIRQGYLQPAGRAAKLLRFEIKDSILQGQGYLPYRQQDLAEHSLYLVVRTEKGLLNIPLHVVSNDPEGAVFFTFARQLNPNVIKTELQATDILVEYDTVIPINKVSLDEVKKVQTPGTFASLKPLKLLDIQHKAQLTGEVNSLKNLATVIDINANQLRFIFESNSFLQELTLYISHTRSVYDPAQVIKTQKLSEELKGNFIFMPQNSSDAVSHEFEIETLRIDVGQMNQRLKDGRLEVSVNVPIRSSTRLEKNDGNNNIWYGMDQHYLKMFSKIVAVNQSMQSFSVTNPPYGGLSIGNNGPSSEKQMRRACKQVLERSGN